MREALAASLSDTQGMRFRTRPSVHESAATTSGLLIHDYLRPAHREKLEAGLRNSRRFAPEIARQDEATRGIVETARGHRLPDRLRALSNRH